MGWMVPLFAAASKKRDEEEEERTMLEQLRRDAPEERYEYKILRSYFFAFGNPERRRAILEQEARAGWEMVAKLDDARVIMRRPRSAREADAVLPPGVDPFRTEVDTNFPLIVGILIAVVLGAVLVIGLLVADGRSGTPVIFVGLVVLGAIVGLVIASRHSGRLRR
jgi:hypothetical protein